MLFISNNNNGKCFVRSIFFFSITQVFVVVSLPVARRGSHFLSDDRPKMKVSLVRVIVRSDIYGVKFKFVISKIKKLRDLVCSLLFCGNKAVANLKLPNHIKKKYFWKRTLTQLNITFAKLAFLGTSSFCVKKVNFPKQRSR